MYRKQTVDYRTAKELRRKFFYLDLPSVRWTSRCKNYIYVKYTVKQENFMHNFLVAN